MQIVRPQPYIAQAEEIIDLNSKYRHLSFELLEPNTLPFAAGQYVSVVVTPEGHRRSYSIVSTPAVTHSFELLVDVEPLGPGAQFFKALQIGEKMSFLAPLGRFTFDEQATSDQLVFVATGSGVAPFRSMILDLLQEKNEKRPIILLWGLRYIEQLFWQAEFQELVDYFPNFSFHPVISKPGAEWPLCRGRVTDCLTVHQFSTQASFYLCGGTGMIEDVQQQLLDNKIAPEQIYTEKFF